MSVQSLPFLVFVLSVANLHSACSRSEAQERQGNTEDPRRIVVTSPILRDVITTQEYVSQIHARRHIEMRALERGYLEEIHVREGQTVRAGEVMFKIIPTLYKANLDSELAEAEVARIKYTNTKVLTDRSVVSDQELALADAELARANARVERARAELNFTMLRAPFSGIVDRQRAQQGSLVEEGDVLSTLSDNQVMWVYFNVPEARYLDYQASLNKERDELGIELKLANGKMFRQHGIIGAIEADFDNETGNIAFRADFPNPDALLRHGQTGTILIHRKLHDAIVIPQRATFEILAKKYVYIVTPEPKPIPVGPHSAKTDRARTGHEVRESTGPRGIVRQREITIREELDDVYVIEDDLGVTDKIVFEGTREVRDGDEVEYEYRAPGDILKNLKFHAE